MHTYTQMYRSTCTTWKFGRYVFRNIPKTQGTPTKFPLRHLKPTWWKLQKAKPLATGVPILKNYWWLGDVSLYGSENGASTHIFETSAWDSTLLELLHWLRVYYGWELSGSVKCSLVQGHSQLSLLFLLQRFTGWREKVEIHSRRDNSLLFKGAQKAHNPLSPRPPHPLTLTSNKRCVLFQNGIPKSTSCI